jgi:ABC-type branched-subunit amino acid transport system ATPase component
MVEADFKEVYDETKVRVACYMATSNNEWIKVSWRNEYLKEQTSLKREAEEAMQRVNMNAQVEFNFGDIKIGNEGYVDGRLHWESLRTLLKKGNAGT